MISEQTYSLNIVPDGKPLRVYVSQYDVGRNLTFAVYNGSAPYDCSGLTAVIAGTKPDDNGFSYAGTVSGSTVTIATTQQMTAIAGQIPCEIRLSNSNSEIVGTANFILNVEQSALDESTIISDSDIASFEQLNAQSLANAGKASESASQAQTYATQAQNAVNSISIVTTSTNSTVKIPSASLEYQDRQNIAKKADLASPSFTGTPTAPIPDESTNNNQIATTSFVCNKVNNLESSVTEILTDHLTVSEYQISSSLLTANSGNSLTLVQKIVGGAVMLTAFQPKFNAGLTGWQTICTLKHGLPDTNIGGTCDIGFGHGEFNITTSGEVRVYKSSGIKSGDVLHLNANWIYGYTNIYTVDADGNETLKSTVSS